MDKKRYTAAFIFNSELTKVLLIQKNRPEWQAGKLNGIGGKLELGETIQEGISREVWEECGLEINPGDWTHFAELAGDDWVVSFFTYKLEEIVEVESKTDEIVDWYSSTEIPNQVIPNLKWLIPLAIYSYQERDFEIAQVKYS